MTVRWLTVHAQGESPKESRMWEIRMSGLTRGRGNALPTLLAKNIFLVAATPRCVLAFSCPFPVPPRAPRGDRMVASRGSRVTSNE